MGGYFRVCLLYKYSVVYIYLKCKLVYSYVDFLWLCSNNDFNDDEDYGDVWWGIRDLYKGVREERVV